jgi:thiamine biosynthesis lipoprotein
MVNQRYYRYRFVSMGCPCEVSLYAVSESQAQKGFEIAKSEVYRLDRKYSHYRPDSFLALALDSATRPEGVEVDCETAALLNYANTQFTISDGLFDITMRPLTQLWDRISALPSEKQIRSAQENTGWNRAIWDGIILKIPAGLEIDMGGIVKEYAADRAALLMKREGFNSGYVDLGGDLLFLGPHPDGSPWRAGIRHPVHKDKPIATIDIYSGGLASSGDYERYSQIDGVRYGHIINPQTGWPIDTNQSGLSAISALAPSCLIAGSTATLALLLGGLKGRDFLNNSGLPWLAIGTAGEVTGSMNQVSDENFHNNRQAGMAALS